MTSLQRHKAAGRGEKAQEKVGRKSSRGAGRMWRCCRHRLNKMTDCWQRVSEIFIRLSQENMGKEEQG